MEKLPAPHEKLTEEEIKSEIEDLLSNHLKMRKKWNGYNDDLGEIFDSNEEIIFRLRRHFSPELTTIMRITLGELTDMMKESTDG